MLNRRMCARICVMLLPKDNLRSEETRAFKYLTLYKSSYCVMIKAWFCDKMMFTAARTLKIEKNLRIL